MLTDEIRNFVKMDEIKQMIADLRIDTKASKI